MPPPSQRLQRVFATLFAADSRSGACASSTAMAAATIASIEADNTSSFNCRDATGTTALVRARIRSRNRHQPDREPVRVRRRHDFPSGFRSVPRPRRRSPRHGGPGRDAGARVRRGWLGLGRTLASPDRLSAFLGQRPVSHRPRRRARVRGRPARSARGRACATASRRTGRATPSAVSAFGATPATRRRAVRRR